MKTTYLNAIIMFMLVSSTGGLLFVFNRNYAFLAMCLFVLLGFFFMAKPIKKAPFISSVLTFLIVVTFFTINYVFAINPQSLTKYSFFGITIFTTLLTLFYFNNQDNRNTFVNSLYFVLKIVLFHSIISFIAYFIIRENLLLISSEYHESLTYFYLFFYSPNEMSMINLFGLEFIRNAGMFWEPGILQAYLNILFFLEVSIFKRDRRLLILIIIAILSTYSTTGLFLLMIQIIYFLQKKFKQNLAIILIAIVGIPLYLLLSANMNDKIYGEGESSFQKRLIDLTQPFFIALENPLTGVGLDIDKFQQVREEFYINSNLNSMLSKLGIEQKVETTSKGSTNSVMYMLAGMGFPTAIFFIYMFIKQQVVTNHRFIWFIITFVSVMSEPLLFRPFFFMFILSGVMYFCNKVTNHKKRLV
tara:strand:+ start:15191 stop:16438 length:1248 start_codon:yes stop_codon:yes gene_type:complete